MPPLESAGQHPADKAVAAGVVHNTPLTPDKTMKDLNPAAKGTAEALEDEQLKKRVADVKIVPDMPAPQKLHLIVATLKTGKYQVLYAGSDRVAADKAAVFDAEKHSEVLVFLQPSPSKRFRAVRSAVTHADPLKPTETMKQYQERLKAAEETTAEKAAGAAPADNDKK